MKRALLALAATMALAAANGCGWQMQNMQGNHCTDGSCAACGVGGGGRLGHGHVGDGQLAARIRSGAHQGPPHVQGDFLTGMKAWHDQKHAPPNVPPGITPTVSYPYYTVRGPRDFFLNDPMPLGY